MHREETVSTLKFGQLCKTIKNVVKSNAEAVDDKTLVKQYKTLIADLRSQLEEALCSTSSGSDSSSSSSNFSQLLAEKSDLEGKVRALETLVMHGAGDGTLSEADLIGILKAGRSSEGDENGRGVAGAGGRETEVALQESRVELNKQAEKVSDLQRKLASLKNEMRGFQDLEEARKSFEDYQQESTQVSDTC